MPHFYIQRIPGRHFLQFPVILIPAEVHLLRTFQTDAGVLKLLQKTYQLRQRRAYLPDNGRNTHHHAQCQISVHHFSSYPAGDKDVPDATEGA